MQTSLHGMEFQYRLTSGDCTCMDNECEILCKDSIDAMYLVQRFEERSRYQVAQIIVWRVNTSTRHPKPCAYLYIT